MARLPRLIVPNEAHHVIQQGNDGQYIFRDNEDHQRFLIWLKDCMREHKVAVHAYVLMPNHFHLLVTPSDEPGLGLAMQRLGRYYVPWFNAKYARTGSLFQGRFKTSVIDPDGWFMLCSRFIESNPLRTHLVHDLNDYPWSSYPHHVGHRVDPLITDHALYWALGNTPFQREMAYREMFTHPLTREQMTQLDASVLKGWPLGSDRFKASLEERAERRVTPARRGRPPKRPAQGSA